MPVRLWLGRQVFILVTGVRFPLRATKHNFEFEHNQFLKENEKKKV